MASNNYKRCIVEGCETRNGVGKRMFQFPGSQVRCNEWIAALNREDLKGLDYQRLQKRGLKVCKDHFRPDCFMNKITKHRLTHFAIPELNLHDSMPISSSFQDTGTLDEQVRSDDAAVSTSTSNSMPLFLVSSGPTASPSIQETSFPSTSAGIQEASDPSTPPIVQKSNVQLTPRRGRKYWSPTKKKLFSKLKKSSKSINYLKSTVLKYKNAIRRFRRFSPEMLEDLLKDHVSPAIRSFIISQVKCDKTTPKGRRYTIRDKSFALSLFHRSPSCYRVLRHLLHLPGKTTLYKFIDGIVRQAGLHLELLAAMKNRVSNLSQVDRECVLVFDEMAVKQHLDYSKKDDCVVGFADNGIRRTFQVANEALVMMVQSIRKPWKQPVGYFFSAGGMNAEKLHEVLTNTLQQVQNTGLRVRSLVCDQSANNRGLFLKLGITAEKPYMVLEDAKLYGIFDPLHLLKSLLRNLKQYDLVLPGSRLVKMRYIADFYEIDKISKYRVARKLTNDHIYGKGPKTMKVSLAAQVFSNTVAAGMNLCIAGGLLPAAAAPTAEFVGKMDSLFT